MRLAGKELRFNWKKYLLVEIIVVLMMFMVVFLSGLVNGLGRAVSSSVENIAADNFILSDDSEKLLTVSNLSQKTADALLQHYGTKATPLDIQRMYLKTQASDDKIDVTYFAIDPNSFINPPVYEGKPLAADNEIVLDDDYASKGIALGDTIEDASTGTTFTVVGFTKDAMYGHVSAAYITTGTYTAMMKQLNPMYQPSVHAIALQGSVDSPLPDNTTAYTKATIIESIPGYKAEQMTIKMVEWLLVVITAVIIGIFFFVINLQKEKEFGVMKAIGIRMSHIVAMLMNQVLIISVLGAVIAAVLVAAMSTAMPATMPFYLETSQVALVLIAFVLISVIGSLASIVKVASIDPASIIGGDFA